MRWMNATMTMALVVSCQFWGGTQSRPIYRRRNGESRPLPVIFVPGKGGNQLEARVDKIGLPNELNSPVHCPRQMDWYRIWMDLWTFFYGGVDCWAENMQLRFNSTTKTSSNELGVDVRVPGWGTTESIEYVDPSWTAWVLGNIGVYATYLVDALVHYGYERDINIRGAPYDFRYAPHSQSDYFQRLRELVEQTSAWNFGSKVLLVGHSMGGLYSAYFLARQPAEWKNRYIAGLVGLNTPWAGTVVVLEMHAAGINWEIDAVDRLVVRGQQRSFETGYLLLPNADSGVWAPSDVLVTTPERNFTVSDYGEFFDAIGNPEGRLQLQALEENGDYQLFEHRLGVPVYCLYGGGLPTPERIVYDKGSAFPDSTPRAVMGDGDGTVNQRSLEACERWLTQTQNDPRHSVILQHYPGVEHNGILSHRPAIDDIFNIATQ